MQKLSSVPHIKLGGGVEGRKEKRAGGRDMGRLGGREGEKGFRRRKPRGLWFVTCSGSGLSWHKRQGRRVNAAEHVSGPDVFLVMRLLFLLHTAVLLGCQPSVDGRGQLPTPRAPRAHRGHAAWVPEVTREARAL